MSCLSRSWARAAVPAALAALVLGVSPAAAAAPKAGRAKPKVEVVFCLDTTGSMGGLIEGAKQKIWAICNQVASGKPTPDLKVGLVAYRDRGDAYVTRVIDLTDDLDDIHKQLMGFRAEGGGDEPESVNQALDDAVHKVKWSTDKKTLRIIFLVGDAAPHMDYKDDVKYPVTCKRACEKGILINAIQCGSSAECMKHWKDICAKAEGSYAQIAQTGGVVAVPTPFDKELARLNAELAGSTLAYGGEGKRAAGRMKAAEAARLPAAPAADRAAYGAKSGRGGAAAGDLADDVREKRVRLEDVKERELPEELKKLKTVKQRTEYLEKLDRRRAEINRKILDLDRKRGEYLKKELAGKDKGKGKDSFDSSVLEMLRKQARKSDIAY